MLIKSTDKKGNPVLFTPREALGNALQKGMKLKNTQEKIFWVLLETMSVDQFASINIPADPTKRGDQGGWQASASGRVNIGYTDSKTDKFYDARPHEYSIAYQTSKDSMGLPDIEVTVFESKVISQNPADLMSVTNVSYKAPAPAPKAAEAPAPKPAAKAAPIPEKKVAPKPAPEKKAPPSPSLD